MPTIDPKIAWPGWETVRLIGRGSFGGVYEIQRDVFGRTEKAALKHIPIPQNDSDIEELYDNGYDDASITTTFQSHLEKIVNEYSLMRELNGSSNVVNCDDYRTVQRDNGIGWDIFIKMELLTPLPKCLDVIPKEEQVVRVAKDMCTALILCKRYNIVHRDIKPQNVFCSKNGDYKLGDFGIAKTVEKTSGGTKIGTYEYMAPEVYHDLPYGAAADIYSLGMMLYWLLNERRTPFLPLPPALPTASEREAARKRRFDGEALPAPAHGSAGLKAIVLKACAYDLKERYQSADEMMRDLNALGTAPAVAPIIRQSMEPAPEEDGTVGAFGAPKTEKPPTTVGAIYESPAASSVETSDATVGAGVPDGPQFAPARGHEASPKETEEATVSARHETPAPATEPAPVEDGTVGAFGTAAPAGAAISRPPVKEQAPDEDATVSAAIPVGAIHESPAASSVETSEQPVGAGVPDGPQFIPARGHEASPKETEEATVSARHEMPAPAAEPAPEEDGTVGAFGTAKTKTPAAPVGAIHESPVAAEPAPEEDKTVSVLKKSQAKKPERPAKPEKPAKPEQPAKPASKNEKQAAPAVKEKSAPPAKEKKSGGKGKLIGIMAAALVAIAAAVILILNPFGKGESTSTSPAATAKPAATEKPAATAKPEATPKPRNTSVSVDQPTLNMFQNESTTVLVTLSGDIPKNPGLWYEVQGDYTVSWVDWGDDSGKYGPIRIDAGGNGSGFLIIHYQDNDTRKELGKVQITLTTNGTKNDYIPSDAVSCEEDGYTHYYSAYRVESITWAKAEGTCRSYRGHLATPMTALQNQTAYKAAQQTGSYPDVEGGVYFGLSDAKKDGTWIWTTGYPFSYSAWKTGEPNGSTWENYACYSLIYGEPNKWLDGDFAESEKWILCEWVVCNP